MRIVATLVAVMVAAQMSVGSVAVAQTDSIATARRQRNIVVPGRSMVTTKLGIVAASQPLAARAGVQMLEQGGNAIDAAIAANAALGLMEPAMNGVGGDLFAIVYEAKTGKMYGLNASGWAPTGLTPEFLASKDIKTMPRRGILLGDGSWRCGRMGRAAQTIRQAGPRDDTRPDHLVRREWLSRHASRRRGVANRAEHAQGAA